MFICSQCGYGSASWLGRCPNCNEWNTFTKDSQLSPNRSSKSPPFSIIPISQIPLKDNTRIPTGIFEFDRVLGGGFVPGEVVLLAGEPGIGKSTLLLQSIKKIRTLYISGEESGQQIKERLQRLSLTSSPLQFSQNSAVESIVQGIEHIASKPELIVIDSIQTIYSDKITAPPGNITQLKECAIQLTACAKRLHIPFLFIGHITKDGDIAGPKTLEHLVDCVLILEGDSVTQFRILRTTKNRFGTTREIGMFEMNQSGLSEVNGSHTFIENSDPSPGKSIAGISEGNRSLFFEVQTLVSQTFLPTPRRIVRGADYSKVLLILAVLKKYLNLPLDAVDVYVNIVGGIQVKSPSADLAIALALVSSLKNVSLPPKHVCIGEVGLLGEVRETPNQKNVIHEAKRLGFSKILAPPLIKHVRSTLSLFGK